MIGLNAIIASPTPAGTQGAVQAVYLGGFTAASFTGTSGFLVNGSTNPTATTAGGALVATFSVNLGCVGGAGGGGVDSRRRRPRRG